MWQICKRPQEVGGTLLHDTVNPICSSGISKWLDTIQAAVTWLTVTPTLWTSQLVSSVMFANSWHTNRKPVRYLELDFLESCCVMCWCKQRNQTQSVCKTGFLFKRRWVLWVSEDVRAQLLCHVHIFRLCFLAFCTHTKQRQKCNLTLAFCVSANKLNSWLGFHL